MSDMFKQLNIDELYTDLFFRDNIADSLPMAKYLAPKIAETLDIKSVLDVGCATGTGVNYLARHIDDKEEEKK